MQVWRGVAGLAVAALIALPACGGDDDDNDDASASGADAPAATAPDPSGFDEYLGLTQDEAGAKAEAEGHPWRVVQVDGEDLPVTMDFVENRLNFSIEDGVVIEVTTG
jgi:hypothetical protein